MRTSTERPPALSTRATAKVTAMSGYYLVALPALFGWSNHLVRTDRTCACPLAGSCPAVSAVADYLRRGGKRAAPPKPGSLIPAACPVCGGATSFEPRLCSPMRGAGWVCLTAAAADYHPWPAKYRYPGETHYWTHMWAELGRLRMGSRP